MCGVRCRYICPIFFNLKKTFKRIERLDKVDICSMSGGVANVVVGHLKILSTVNICQKFHPDWAMSLFLQTETKMPLNLDKPTEFLTITTQDGGHVCVQPPPPQASYSSYFLSRGERNKAEMGAYLKTVVRKLDARSEIAKLFRPLFLS